MTRIRYLLPAALLLPLLWLGLGAAPAGATIMLPGHHAVSVTTGTCPGGHSWVLTPSLTTTQDAGLSYVVTWAPALSPDGSWHLGSAPTFSATGVVLWSDGFTQSVSVSVIRPAACATTTVPPTVPSTPPPTPAPSCPGIPPVLPNPDGSCPPVDTLAPLPTTVPTTPPTTIVCVDGNPPSVHLEDGSIVCPEFGAPPASTPPPSGGAAATVVERQVTSSLVLPATGSGTVAMEGATAGTLIVVGTACLLVLLAARRRKPQDPTWPTGDEVNHGTRPVGYHRIRQGRPGRE